MTLTLNSLLQKRYRIENKLGQGGFGAVYQALDTRLNVRCAVKESLRTTEGATRQFKREGEMLAKLRHSNLVRVTDYFIIPDQGQYLVMDFVAQN
jgi:serine/threonine protein kinase